MALIIDEIAQYIDAEGLGTYSETGGNIFLAQMGESTSPADIGLFPTAAPAINDSRSGYMCEGLQIQLRGRSPDPTDVIQLGQWIYNKLHRYRDKPFVTDGIYIISCLAQQGGVNFIGADENQRPMYSINFLITYKNPDLLP